MTQREEILRNALKELEPHERNMLADVLERAEDQFRYQKEFKDENAAGIVYCLRADFGFIGD